MNLNQRNNPKAFLTKMKLQPNIVSQQFQHQDDISTNPKIFREKVQFDNNFKHLILITPIFDHKTVRHSKIIKRYNYSTNS